MNYHDLGFLRIGLAAPTLALANPKENAHRINAILAGWAAEEVHVAVFPELCLTGYSCEDLFFSAALHQDTHQALAMIAAASRDTSTTIVVGLPWQLPDGRLLNCAAVVSGGAVCGLVPKTALPNYGEFYEQRWFSSGRNVDVTMSSGTLGQLHISANQLFQMGDHRFAVELCEDLWSANPPSTDHALAGAELIVNLSASNELVAKADYRRALVRMTSARTLTAYAYCSSGYMESTKDLVFGGHLLAAENGELLGESPRFKDNTQLIVDIDLQHIRTERMRNVTFADHPRATHAYTVHSLQSRPSLSTLRRRINPLPFVPGDEHELDARAEEILHIQATGLRRRMLAANTERLVLGISGGLDSTLALLVCVQACRDAGIAPGEIHALTMPGPGTSASTLANAKALAEHTGTSLVTIPIGAAVEQHLSDLNHTDQDDVVFENAQARERTQLLFNYANKHGGIVVGTGDLSELALGWCTFNADHMANYNVNASVPKTLIAYVVRWFARHQADAPLAETLTRVLETPISPELLPLKDGEIAQRTEDIIGPYVLHDFFLYHHVRHGSTPTKIFWLATHAFERTYNATEILKWMRVFFRRFYQQQFKRTTLPPGPKVGSVSLSPRGDWRMPDEASAEPLLREIDQLSALHNK